MLRSLKDLFEAVVGAGASQAAQREHSLELATAVLLVEVMRADPALTEDERETAMDAMRRSFSLADDEIARLIELAHAASRTASDFHQFTSVLNDRLSVDEKVRVVEHMWRVAYADGRLDVHENHVISRVAELLHVTHGQYIAAKLRARPQEQP